MGDALHGLAAAADSMDGSETTAEVDGAPAAGKQRAEGGGQEELPHAHAAPHR